MTRSVRLRSPEDRPVAIVFADPATSENRRATVRANIHYPARAGVDGTTEISGLVAAFTELSAMSLPDGRPQSPGGQPYTPDWIEKLEQEAAHEQAIGATTRRLTASRGSALPRLG